MGISLGLVGLGSFGSGFAELFKSHPLVDRVALCDREPERIKKFADKKSFQDKFKPSDAYLSFEEICKSDLDALVIITQPWLHAPQAIATMKAGKHVYSAVPIISLPDMDEVLDWCDKLIETCRSTGMSYMLGETTYFRSQAMYCRRKAKEGAFGDFVYGEGEYIHPYNWPKCDLREVNKQRTSSKSGKEWLEQMNIYRKKGIKNSPMSYPTHSVSGPVSVMNAHMTQVSAAGYRSRSGDNFFDDSLFSNITALYKMSNGATVRICEFRELGYTDSDIFETETFRIFGTEATFRDNRWVRRDGWKVLQPEEMRDPLPQEVSKAFKGSQGDSFYGGHGGSHAYLVHEFVDAVANNRLPAINAWEAASYMAAGAAAHKSAQKDGELVKVQDWGSAPKCKIRVDG